MIQNILFINIGGQQRNFPLNYLFIDISEMKYKGLISNFRSFSEKAPVQNEPLPTWSRAFILCVGEAASGSWFKNTHTHTKKTTPFLSQNK